MGIFITRTPIVTTDLTLRHLTLSALSGFYGLLMSPTFALKGGKYVFHGILLVAASELYDVRD